MRETVVLAGSVRRNGNTELPAKAFADGAGKHVLNGDGTKRAYEMGINLQSFEKQACGDGGYRSMDHMTAKVSCFALAYHYLNNTVHIFADTAAGALLGEDYDRIYAECDPRNESSWRLPERTGLRREAHLRENLFFHRDDQGNPIWKDTYVYAVLSRESIQYPETGMNPEERNHA